MGKIIALAVFLFLAATVTGAFVLSKSIGRSIEMSAAQDVAERRAAAARAERWHKISIEKEEALIPAKVQAAQNFYYGLATVGVFSLGLLVVAVAGAGCYAAVGMSRAAVVAANTRATLIPIDYKTRQYPLLPYQVGGHLRVYNPNTGSVVSLDQVLQPNTQMITAMGATQLAGAIAYEASKSHDPAGVAMINPPLVVEG